MIKDTKLLQKFENNLLKNEPLSYKDALKIFEALWHEANSLGILPSKDPMGEIEVKIKMAKILNSCSKNF
jgi:adenine specific DNA methylase Mod